VWGRRVLATRKPTVPALHYVYDDARIFMLTELPRRCSDPRLLLWVSPVDAQGIPADPMFLEAAERIGSDFTNYRTRDLNDPSRALEFAERAVYLASRAKKKRPVEDAVAYLFRTFTNLVDREIERTRRFVALDDDLLRFIGRRSAGEPEAGMEKAITWREALDTLDPTMRWVLWRLYWGFSVNEIADQLGISPNTLSQRICRTRKHLKKVLDRTPQMGARSVDARQSPTGGNSRRVDSRRGLPSAGADGVRRPPQSRPARLPDH
jgi:RNA polymerase sigma factor (sigma-70 family)